MDYRIRQKVSTVGFLRHALQYLSLNSGTIELYRLLNCCTEDLLRSGDRNWNMGKIKFLAGYFGASALGSRIKLKFSRNNIYARNME